MFDFDGVDQYGFNDNGLLGIDVDETTVAFEVTVNSRSGLDDILNLTTALSEGFRVQFSVDAPASSGWRFLFEQRFSTTDGNWRYDTDLSFGTRHHILVHYNRGDVTNDPNIYIDGSLISENETVLPEGTATAGEDSIVIAAGVGINQFLDGELAELAIWSGDKSALAPSLSAGFTPKFFPADLLAYYDLIRDGRDQGPDRANLTLVNSPAILDHPPVIYPELSQIGITVAAAGVLPPLLGGGLTGGLQNLEGLN